ncbi:protein kinase [Belliella sp. DSM 107340]|uniref:non-specific serine/threonine protein kinase n=1 Tax=Belliella calami TaxID=2923436 RepID=A0ABS9UU30_9BACT|nr:protein kinase [Belliella calami]MCH7400003.1 protein kinase [Belliella calami]
MKKNIKKLISEDQLKAIEKSILDIILDLDHPNINSIEKLQLDTSETEAFSITPFCNLTSLNEFIDKYPVSLEMVNVLIWDTLTGLSYLHSKKLVHSDLKLSNILMHKVGKKITFKLGDLLTLKRENTFLKIEGGFYTPEIIAPEVYESGMVTSKMDIWSFGVLLYILFTKKYPFGDRRNIPVSKIKENIKSKSIIGPPLVSVMEPYNHFIELCLSKKPNERPTAKDLLEMIEQ